MDTRHAAYLITLFGAGCAAAPASSEPDGLPTLAARLQEVSAGANVVAFFNLSELRHERAAQALAAERLTWPFWQGSAAILQMDPFESASAVAVAVSVGPCGPGEAFVLASPSDSSAATGRRVDAAIGTWRADHQAQPAYEIAESPDPALSAWVDTPNGPCTILQVGDYDQMGLTLTRDGYVFLHSAWFGQACLPDAGIGLDPERAEVTLAASRALAIGWRATPWRATPLLAEAWPDAAETAWIDQGGVLAKATVTGDGHAELE